MTDLSRFDRDPDALAWARAKVQAEVDRAVKFAADATAVGDVDATTRWASTAHFMRRTLIGGEDCVVGQFDERLPSLATAVDHSIPPRIDRAVRRDHSLCGAEPCSDCR